MTEPFALVLRSVEVMPVIAKLVVVAWVVVERRPVKFCKVVEPKTVRLLLKVPEPETYRELERKVVANSEVDVAFVVVALTPVKSCSVDEPVESRLPNIPEVKKPVVARTRVEKKFELLVALVVVALTPVKFWRVVEEFTRS